MLSRPGRWSLAAAGVFLALLPAFLLLRLQPQAGAATLSASAATAAGSPTQDVRREPWFGMQLLHANVVFSSERHAARTQPNVTAAGGILVDPDSGRILWEVNAHAQLPPASTMKLLTSLIVLTNFNPERVLTITPAALQQNWDESKMGLHAGDRMTVRELLTGMLMASANDAADALAVDTVGMERFVGAMNAEVQALGLDDTHATSPVGLDDPRMYSSAYDLATLATIDEQEYPLFEHLVSTPFVELPASRLHPAFSMGNINLLLSMYPAATGIKTGYTGNAGACLVGEAERNGHRLISVLLNANLVYTQSRRLLDWGFTQEGLPTQLPVPSPSASASPSPHH